MADTPLGRGLIEIGANLAPLERGLAQAQAKTRAALGGAAVGGGAASSVSSAAAITEDISATNRATQAQNNLATSTARANAQKVGIGKSISNATAGLRGFAGAITGTIGAFTGIGAAITLAAGAVSYFKDKQEEAKKKDLELRNALEATKKAFQEFNKTANFTAEGILYQPTQLDSDLAKIKEFFDQAKTLQSDAYKAEVSFIQNSSQSKEEKQRKIQALTEESGKRSEQLELERIKAIAKVEQDSLDRLASKRATALYENEVRAAQAAGDERKVIDLKAAEEKRQLTEQLAKMEEGYDKDILSKRLSIIEAERLAAHKKINDQEQAEKEANQKIADEKAKQNEQAANEARQQAKAFAEAQRAAFGQLQSQINSLFNTGNMEAGMSRIAGLLQVLIDKTERG